MAHLLIVDDEPAVARLLASQLTQAGHECLICDQGLDGFKAAISEKIDMIITDVMMPQWSGRDLVGALDLMGKKTKILAVTGHSGDTLTTELVQHPQVMGVLKKPWKQDDLIEIVARHTGSPPQE